jgi:hypothetical protein
MPLRQEMDMSAASHESMNHEQKRLMLRFWKACSHDLLTSRHHFCHPTALHDGTGAEWCIRLQILSFPMIG